MISTSRIGCAAARLALLAGAASAAMTTMSCTADDSASTVSDTAALRDSLNASAAALPQALVPVATPGTTPDTTQNPPSGVYPPRNPPPAGVVSRSHDPMPQVAGETQRIGGTMAPRTPPPAGRERDSAIGPAFEITPEGHVKPIRR